MKLSEAIREIENDRSKVFESDVEGYTVLKATKSGCSLRFEDVTHNENSALISLNRDWHEVKKPVPWQEAIEAWANGNAIRFVTSEYEWIIHPDNQIELDKDKIKNGKWFIEEDKQCTD